MFRKSFLYLVIAALAAITVMGQTPEAKADKEKAVRAFSFALDGDGGYLGVQTKEVTKDNYSKLGLSSVRGVAIEKVLDNSPAAAAGLKAGDVIIRFENEEITSVRKLTRMVGEVAPDLEVRIAVLRNGVQQEIMATVGKRPAAQFGNGSFVVTAPPLARAEIEKLKDLSELKDLNGTSEFDVPGGKGKVFRWSTNTGRQIGVGVMLLSKQLSTHFGVDSGVLISEVRDGSPAAKAGLKAGDIIVEADGKAVKDNFDLIRAIGEKKEGDVTLTFIRDGKRQTLSVTPEAAKDNGFVLKSDGENSLVGPIVPGPFDSLLMRDGQIL
jgi:membrane-associated protease RseP (regulator of RpoE activity)